ncbi:hypothetical protein [uncultured Sphingomonas sp.]|uniref:hypothetical protein n=1 Tax=uncultured Sphingomonas sp. TaxID=158754 RepID=UPI0035CA9455
MRIPFADESAFLLGSGLHFLDELRQDAEELNSPPAVRRDWQVIATWLQHGSGPLVPSEKTRVERAWAAYLAVGLAPSRELQPAFDHFAQQVRAAKVDKPPTAVMNVFDRLLATDDQIGSKREADLAAERERFASIFSRHEVRSSSPPWLTSDRPLRSWLFLSAVWFVVRCCML